MMKEYDHKNHQHLCGDGTRGSGSGTPNPRTQICIVIPVVLCDLCMINVIHSMRTSEYNRGVTINSDVILTWQLVFISCERISKHVLGYVTSHTGCVG